MARLSETRYCKEGSINPPSAGKFVPLKFRPDVYPHSEFERFVRNNGSYFTAFNIEPFPFERDRVATRMSDEDRARRAKWMKDQDLAKDEPRTHKSLMDKIKPKNAIRRLVKAPGNMLEGALTNVMVGDLAQPLSLVSLPFTLATRGFNKLKRYHVCVTLCIIITEPLTLSIRRK